MTRNAGMIALALLVSACSEETICDAVELAEALESAQAGETVRVGNCRISGNFLVPAGVTLQGEGQENSALNGGGGAVVRIEPGSTRTVVSSLMIESSGPVAVLARNAGNVGLIELAVRASLGVGVAAEDVDSIEMTGVTVLGPVDTGNAMSIPVSATSTEAATYGLVLRNVPLASLERVTVNGFAEFGATFLNSSVFWERGGAGRNRQVGLYASGGAIDLRGDVEVSAVFKPRIEPSFGAIFTAGVAATSERLIIEDVDGYGMLQVASTGAHTGIQVARNREDGVRIEDMMSFDMSGSIIDNRIVGLAVLSSSNVNIHDMSISGTVQTTKMVTGVPDLLAGDGIQVVNSTTGISLRDLTLTNNGRVGLLIELNGRTLEPNTVGAVEVTGSGMQLGAIAQDGTIPADWDDNVARVGDTLVNDLMFSGELPALEVTGPCDYPRPEPLEVQGLLGIIGL